MRPSLAIATTLLAAASLIAAAASPARADDASARTLSLTGRAEVRAAPDMAVISAGTVSEANTAREALSANNETMAAVLKTIAAAGVAEKDIQTSNFSIQPKYTYPPRASDGAQEAPRIDGYTVSNTVTVLVRNLDRLGAVMDAVVSSGVNQMNGLNFTIAEPEPLRNEARKRAVADALARAQLYADAAGVKLGSRVLKEGKARVGLQVGGDGNVARGSPHVPAFKLLAGVS